jgi:hypothetical protein
MAATTAGSPSSSAVEGMPAASRSASDDSCSEDAIASSTCSEGARSPRSICERYGFETPAIPATWRIESSLSSRCRRMNSPSAAARLSAMRAA